MIMNKKKITCTVCNYEADLYRELSEVIIYYCNNCKHFFTDQESIKNKEDYSTEYFTERHPNWFQNPDLKLWNYILKYIKKINLKSPSVIDVGCGNGDFLRYLKQRSKDIHFTGIDYKKNLSEDRINFLSGDFFNTEFKEKFDVVISLGVIEHIWDVKTYALRLSQLCKKDGLIVVMTPNSASLLFAFARYIYYFGMKSPMEGLYDKHHLNHFSKNSLEYLFKNCSLKIVENHLTQFKVSSISIPKCPLLIKAIYKLGLIILYLLEKFFWGKNKQTLIAKN